MATQRDQGEEWEALYEELSASLSSVGRSDPFGEGDYWIVDDNYGSPQHKVCVSRVSFVTPEVVSMIQRLLRKFTLNWEVLLVFDPRDARLHPDDRGMSVRKDVIAPRWRAERMAARLGADFAWSRGSDPV